MSINGAWLLALLAAIVIADYAAYRVRQRRHEQAARAHILAAITSHDQEPRP